MRISVLIINLSATVGEAVGEIDLEGVLFLYES